MNEVFDVNQYWSNRGRGYMGEKFPQDYHRLQEQFLLDALKAAGKPFRRILDLGCGFGRITRVLADAYPEAAITAVDLSAEQLENARRYCEGRPNIEFAAYDLNSEAPVPGLHHDLVVAIEVFMHHPGAVLQKVLQRLATACRHIVNIDWSEEWHWPRPEHVWIHDYSVLYHGLGLEYVAVPVPQRIDGLQQKLFFAARHVEEAVRALAPSTPVASLPAPPARLQWYVQLEQAIADLNLFVPEKAELILINDDEWGGAGARLSPRRVLPFVERGGKYWGRPLDDRDAIAELTRMERAGATHMAVAWNSFWWLEHYTDFAGYLSANYRNLVSNDRVMIFQLTN
jgi:SAM-dependent methyltransferase